MKNPNAPGIWVRLGTFLLAFVLMCCAVYAIFVADIRIVTDKDNLSAIIRQALFSAQTVRPARTGSGTGAAAVRTQPRLSALKLAEAGTSGEATDALVEWIYGVLEEQFGDEMDVSLESVQAFVDESTLKDELADLGASLISDFYTGENTTVLDAETVAALVRENAALIEQHFGYQVTEDTIALISQTVENNDFIAQLQTEGIAQVLLGSSTSGSTASGGEDTGITDGIEGIDGENLDLAGMLQSFRDVTSTASLIGCIAAAVVCIGLIILLNRKWISRILRCTGTPLLLASLPYLIPTFIALALETTSSLGAAVQMIFRLTAPVCISVFAVGLGLCIAALVVTIVSRNKKDATKELSDALIEETNP